MNLGCGLNASFEAVADADAARLLWIDLDLAEVIAIRRNFYSASPHRSIIEGDVTDPRLFARLAWEPGRPAIVVAEGLLYYLGPAQVETFFRSQAEAADVRGAHLEMVFDYAGPLGAWMVGRRPAHRQLGTSYAWALRLASDLQRLDPRLEVVEDSDVFLGAMNSAARRLNSIYRLIAGGSIGGCLHLRRPAPI